MSTSQTPDTAGSDPQLSVPVAAPAATSQADLAARTAPHGQARVETEQSPPTPDSNVPGRQAARREFPPFTRSLLRVRVPVVVILAQKKQPLGRILEMGPGQIIQFEKSCDEVLDMEAGNCLIASGEAVKVGDKFGLRITSIIPPEERFITVKPRSHNPPQRP